MIASLKRLERLVVQVLMGLMALVVVIATADLAWLIVQDVLTPPVLLLSVEQLLDIFGLFMLVLIGIELLETVMKTYLTRGEPHYEVVLSVAIIAIARKVIILDVKEVDGLGLIGIAAIVLALAGAYSLMRRCRQAREERESSGSMP